MLLQVILGKGHMALAVVSLVLIACTTSWAQTTAAPKGTAVAPKVATGKHAEQVKACYNADKTKFSTCLKDYLMGPIKKEAAIGAPDLGIPALDPMSISNIEFNEQGAVVQVNAVFSNVVVEGVSTYTIPDLLIDTKSGNVTVVMTIPKLHVTGSYKLSGTILLLPVEGEGPFVLDLTGIDAKGQGRAERHGASGVRLGEFNFDFTIKGIKVDAKGILGGDEVGTAVLNMLNDNSQQILDDIKPQVVLKLKEGISNVIDGLYLELPAEAFIDHETSAAPK